MAKLFKLYADGFRDYPNDDLINFLKQEFNLDLHYFYGNIFDHIFYFPSSFGNFFDHAQTSKGVYKKEFIRTFYELFKKDIKSIYPVKLLIDSFIYNPIKTVFSLNSVNNDHFYITKGQKKIIAFDVLNLTNAHMLLLGPSSIGNKIGTTQELYWILRRIDPSSHNFHIILDLINNVPQIHYAESIDTIGKWSSIDNYSIELLENSMPMKAQTRVKFLGNAYTTDGRITDDYHNYHVSVFSKEKADISLDYISLCSSNLYFKALTRVGVSLDQKIRIEYNRNSNFYSADFIIPNF